MENIAADSKRRTAGADSLIRLKKLKNYITRHDCSWCAMSSRP